MAIQSLYESGEILYKNKMNDETIAYAHLYQFFDYEVLIDYKSNFIKAYPIKEKDEMTLIPSTILGEERSNDEGIPTPFGLHDTLIHLSGDYKNFYNADNTRHIDIYLKQLYSWCNSGKANKYIEIILIYLQKGCLIQDMNYYIHDMNKKSKVRFAVSISENDIYHPWLDLKLISDYAEYYHDVIVKYDNNAEDFCYVTGKKSIILHNAARSYIPNMVFAKLFTKDDRSKIFTYKGRFHDANETACIGKRTSFTINFALRWLVKNRSIKVGDIYYIFYDINLRSCWHVFDSTASLLKSFELSFNNISDLEQKMFDMIGTDNKLICFGLGALTLGRLNIFDYNEYVGTDIKKLIHNIILYHTSSICCNHYLYYPIPDLISVIRATIGIKYADTHSMNSGSKKNDLVLLHEYVKIFLKNILCAKPLPDIVIENALLKVCNVQRERPNEVIDGKSLINVVSLLVIRKINMNEENIDTLYNDDVQIIAGRLLAIMHWEEFRLKYYLNKRNKGVTKFNVWLYESLAKQYFNEYRISPYKTWIQLNFQLNNIEKKLKTLGKESIIYTNLKAKLESILYNNDFHKIHNLDGRVLLGFDLQIYDILIARKNSIQPINIEEKDIYES